MATLGATALRALSNDQKGFTLSFGKRGNMFDRVTIAGLGVPLDLANDGRAARYAYAGRETALEWSYRFYLPAGLAPGNYPLAAPDLVVGHLLIQDGRPTARR